MDTKSMSRTGYEKVITRAKGAVAFLKNFGYTEKQINALVREVGRGYLQPTQGR